ncbi:MAG: hypothetical protein JWQ72_393 [Polaromonas sp.]|nr:hypothetical protein [Polaromonas sp.]
MKSLVLFALSAIASAAMAAGPTPASEIRITGNSTQAVTMLGSAASNTASGEDALAQQNIASNAGNVTISGNSVQTVSAFASVIGNTSNANTVAQQNLSSNVGDVYISGNSSQATSLLASFVLNSATGRDATAVQNIASNNACFACTTTGSDSGHGHGH